MKHPVLMLVSGALALSLAAPAVAQQTLPEVTVIAANYKYLQSVGGKEVAMPVQKLQRTAAAYNVKKSDYYEEDYDSYFISFYIPDGKILAAYDSDGKLLRTAEKYKNVSLPPNVAKAVVERFPNWSITSDTYLVTYYGQKEADKKYKLLLQNGDKRLRIQVNDKGEFF